MAGDSIYPGALMSNQLQPVTSRAGNTMGARLAQTTFLASAHNNPDAIFRHFGSGWANGMCPTVVDAATAIGGGRVGDIVPTTDCTFHLEVSKIAPSGGSRYHWDATFNSVTSSAVTQAFDGSLVGNELSRPSWGFVPGWNGAAPVSGTELWALLFGRWACGISYSYTHIPGINSPAAFANVDLLFKSLATTIGSQSQSAIPNSHPLSASGSVAFNEDADLLAHPLWLPRFNLQASSGGAQYDAITNGTVWFEMDATFERYPA